VRFGLKRRSLTTFCSALGLAAHLFLGIGSARCAAAQDSESVDPLDRRVDIRATSQDLKTLLADLFEGTGLSYELVGDFKGRVAMEFSSKTTLKDSLVSLATTYRLCVYYDGARVMVFSPTSMVNTLIRTEADERGIRDAVSIIYPWYSPNTIKYRPLLSAVSVCGPTDVTDRVKTLVQLLPTRKVKMIRYGHVSEIYPSR
jgi:hypothetical protein